jgi:nucleotide-binding universal stress UspA family protein
MSDIVVGIDGSEDSKRALRWAVDEAELRGVRVRAVLCWSYLGISGSELGIGTTEEEARASLEADVVEAVGDRAAIVDAVPVNDLPVSGILSSSEGAALLVVGSRGRGGVKGLVLGSVSRTIVERSTIPVVVVPHEHSEA